MASTYYVNQGRLVKDKGITRGGYLVWTEEEWRKMFDIWVEKTYGLVTTIALTNLTFVIMIPFMAIAYFFLPDGPARNFMIIFILLICLIPFALVHRTRTIYKKLPVPSLREHGLQYIPRTFIPYTEIATTERKAIGWRKKQEALVLIPRYQRREGGFKIKVPWTILIEFISEEAAKELEARVRGDIGPYGPPELHIYGTYK